MSRHTEDWLWVTDCFGDGGLVRGFIYLDAPQVGRGHRQADVGAKRDLKVTLNVTWCPCADP